MNILILGSGGREHSLGWKLSQSPKVNKIYFYPGNSGTKYIGKNIDIDLSNPDEMICAVKNLGVELVVIGPFRYLNHSHNVVDTLRQAGIRVFGPNYNAAIIERSKIFSKQLMKKIGIPTPRFEIFRDIHSACEFVKNASFPLVIKTDFPILGLGVEIVYNQTSAFCFLNKVFNRQLGDYGGGIVIEEFVQGIEVSAHAFCDGRSAIMMPFTQDHKRLLNGDRGVNTSGIGAVTPVPIIANSRMEEIRQEVVLPILSDLYKNKSSFCGVMYPGVVFTKDKWVVLEINARFGDPEAQNYMALLESDLLEIILACVNGTLDTCEVRWSKESACSVVLAINGYPDHMITNMPIFGLSRKATVRQSSSVVFHNETRSVLGWPFTYGHRVATVTSKASTLAQAIKTAYQDANNIHYFRKYVRKDIGSKVLNQ